MLGLSHPISLLIVVLSALIAITPAHAKKIAKTDIPDTLEVAGQTLTLNGAGLRSKTIIKVYIGSLYLAAASSDAATIVAADEPMAIQLNVLSRFLSKSKMKDALLSGFKKSTGGNTEPVQPGIDKLLALMDDKITKKDIYLLAYDSANGITVSKNAAVIGSVEGLAFKQALFGIWLSDSPVQASLKNKMLGK